MNGAKRATINGKRYEQQVNAVCREVVSPHLPEVALSTSSAEQLGGCSSDRCDLVLNWKCVGDTVVEVKVRTAPDWMQATIVPGDATKRATRNTPLRWHVKDQVKNAAIHDVFNRTMEHLPTPVLFDGQIPPFLNVPATSISNWDQIKSGFKDQYIPVCDDEIAKAYAVKGAQYIQVSGYGLYHLVHDTCGFGTIPFRCQQRLRIRCKRHGRKSRATHRDVPSSVTVSLRPILKTLKKSPVSLDRLQSLSQLLKMTT
jgi:hypothetical protein